jgi:hypothetical protein
VDKYNLKTPTNYAEMAQNMEIVHQAEPDVNGMMFHSWGFDYQFSNYAMLFGTNGRSPSSLVYDYSKNKWVFNLTENKDIFLNATKAMSEAYSKGWLNADFSTMSGDVWLNDRNNGKWLYNFHYPITAAEQRDTIKAKAVYLDPPVAAGITPTLKTDYESDTTGWAFIISKTAKNPELCAALLDFFSSEEFAKTYHWGFEGVSYQTGADGTKTFIDSYLKMPDTDKQTKLGLNQPYVVVPFISNFYAGDAISAAWSDESKRGVKMAAEKLKSGEFTNYYGPFSPDFTDDVNEKMTTIGTAVGTYITENLTAFVLGKKPISDWDSFIAGIKKYGDTDWVVEQYNTAVQKPLRANATDRVWLMP